MGSSNRVYIPCAFRRIFWARFRVATTTHHSFAAFPLQLHWLKEAALLLRKLPLWLSFIVTHLILNIILNTPSICLSSHVWPLTLLARFPSFSVSPIHFTHSVEPILSPLQLNLFPPDFPALFAMAVHTLFRASFRTCGCGRTNACCLQQIMRTRKSAPCPQQLYSGNHTKPWESFFAYQ